MIVSFHTVCSLACFVLFHSVVAIIPESNFTPKNILDYDVVVIGGGSAGTYTSARLRDLNKTVAIVETKGRLGGHTETYTDPVSGGKIDIGVVVWHNTDFVRNYFARFDVPLETANLAGPGITEEPVDFSTGKVDKSYVPANATAGLLAYSAQLAKYPYLITTPGKLPEQVPADLLLSFGDFVKKYPAVGDSVFTISRYVGGYGNILRLPMLYIFKSFTPGLIESLQIGFLTTARHDNSELYEKFTAEIGKDAFLNSNIIAMDRGTPGCVRVAIQTPTGPKLIRAKKLVATIPPILGNLHGFDLDSNEISIFKQLKYHSYYAGVLNNSGIPDTLSLDNVGASTSFNLPVLPGAYSINPTRAPDLKVFQVGSNDGQVLTNQQAEDVVVADVERLRAAGTIPESAAKPTFPIFSSHNPFEVYLEAGDVKKGLYNKQFALQGKKNTWWTGAAFVTHDSSEIWEYTEGLIRDIAA